MHFFLSSTLHPPTVVQMSTYQAKILLLISLRMAPFCHTQRFMANTQFCYTVCMKQNWCSILHIYLDLLWYHEGVQILQSVLPYPQSLNLNGSVLEYHIFSQVFLEVVGREKCAFCLLRSLSKIYIQAYDTDRRC